MGKQNEGKKFEKDLENSSPAHVFMHRVRDVMFMAGSGSICDYIVYKHPNLFLFELKTHKGASLPIAETYYESGKREGELKSYGVISVKQLDGLKEESDKLGIKAGFIVNFREKYSTFYVSVDKVYEFVKNPKRERSSIPLKWFEENGVRIPQKKRSNRVNSRWGYDFRFLDML